VQHNDDNNNMITRNEDDNEEDGNGKDTLRSYSSPVTNILLYIIL